MKPIVAIEALQTWLDRGAVLVDARPEAAYLAGHLVGAVHAHLERDLSNVGDPAHGGRHPLPEPAVFAATLGRWGIGPDTPVITYDADGGGSHAARVWWMLGALGHGAVAVLDGGLAAARAANWPTTTASPVPTPRGPYPADRFHWPTVEADTVDRLRADPRYRVVDARSHPRFRGETEPFDPVAGHIPGAVCLPWTELVHDGRLRPASELKEIWQQVLGDRGSEHLVVHCGSGVTACHLLWSRAVLGLAPGAVYVGSWGEWCRQPRPRGSGDPTPP